jgi:uncharacterized delta-60 repeat protein
MRKLLLTLAAALLGVSLVTGAAAAAGDLDPSFGNGGKVQTGFAGEDVLTAMAIQPNGKIVAAGYSWAPTGSFYVALARYNTDGGLDMTFGSNGKVLTDLGANATYGIAVAVQPNGKIIVAGASAQNGVFVDFAVARYNGDGTLDTTFGSDGIVTTDFGAYDVGRSIAVQPNGKVIVAGETAGGMEGDFAVARYNQDGTLDTTFGSGGKVTTDFGGYESAHSVAIRPSGRIVAAGWTSSSGFGDFAIARYNADGSLDGSFGADGKVVTDVGGYPDFANAVAVQPNGKVVAVGSSGTATADSDFAVTRYNSNGTLDTDFGSGGKVTTDFRGVGTPDVAYAAAVEPNGRIVAAGETLAARRFFPDFAVARYNTDGSADTTFGSGGQVITNFGLGSLAWAVAVQRDGKIVAGGQGSPATNLLDIDFALARYLP